MTTEPSRRPPPIRTDKSNAFANDTMRRRLPAIIDETIASNDDYPAGVKDRLRQLRDEIRAGARIKRLRRGMGARRRRVGYSVKPSASNPGGRTDLALPPNGSSPRLTPTAV